MLLSFASSSINSAREVGEEFASVISLPGDSRGVLQQPGALRGVAKAYDAFGARRSDARLVQDVEGVQVHAQLLPFGDRHGLVDTGAQVRDPRPLRPLVA